MSEKMECGTCFYWERQKEGDGDCRAVPPTPLVVPMGSPLVGAPKGIGVLAFFPRTLSSVWCGMYKSKVAYGTKS